MQTLVHADIFFFISSVFVVVLTAGLVIALWYVIPILRDLRRLSDLSRKEGEKLFGEIDDVRGALRKGRFRIKSVFDYFLGLFIKRKNNHKKTTINK